ncbi:hypothetical protein WBP07_27475 [Novosphingobium sp. BL-8A]
MDAQQHDTSRDSRVAGVEHLSKPTVAMECQESLEREHAWFGPGHAIEAKAQPDGGMPAQGSRDHVQPDMMTPVGQYRVFAA